MQLRDCVAFGMLLSQSGEGEIQRHRRVFSARPGNDKVTPLLYLLVNRGHCQHHLILKPHAACCVLAHDPRPLATLRKELPWLEVDFESGRKTLPELAVFICGMSTFSLRARRARNKRRRLPAHVFLTLSSPASRVEFTDVSLGAVKHCRGYTQSQPFTHPGKSPLIVFTT
ncbi:Uncharacterised protein [Paucimonas lemoignei]|nr:Uncharacterised protein [Paucimonas lemoignei]